MLRTLIAQIVTEAVRALAQAGTIPAAVAEIAPDIADPRNPEHGDFACNLAMVAAKVAGMNPRALGEIIAAELRTRPEFSGVEVAGPGFLNLRIAPAVLGGLLPETLALGAEGLTRRMRSDDPQRINVEFVSVNPNGPITIGSGRGAAYGSALCAVFEAAGHTVAREYYINDGVNSEQMRVFAESVRALALGRPLPETAYRGDYVQAVAEDLRGAIEAGIPQPLEGEDAATRATRERRRAAFGRLADASRASGTDQAVAEADVQDLKTICEDRMIAVQRDGLAAFGVEFDAWFSEQSLHDLGAVDRCIDELQVKGLADDDPYRTIHKMGRGGKIEETTREEQPNDEDDAAGEGRTLWLRSSRLGDDMDRVLRRRDGRLTYIASDVAYHQDKFNRPAEATRLITILGPDHHGYIARLRAVVAAMLAKPGQEPTEALAETDRRFEVVIYQLVRFLKDGQPAPMRKRDGNIYALFDLLKEIGGKVKPDAPEEEQLKTGKDVARFFYLMRSHDSTFDFDLDLAARQSEENPVFYVQYAHARICSVLRKAEESEITRSTYDPDALGHPREAALMKMIYDLPNEVRRTAEDYGVHRIAAYAVELARAYHGFYDSCRVIQADQPALTAARLDLCRATRIALQGALGLLGVEAPERMERTERLTEG